MSINKNEVYKIRDSVDIFVTDDKLLTIYYIGTRQKKSFRISKEMIKILEMIDGVTDVESIQNDMFNEYDISKESSEKVFKQLKEFKIIMLNTVFETYGVDLQRYDRQINYFSEWFSEDDRAIKSQAQLHCSKVLIFGCGAVGGTIALQLVMAGIREITLFDYDIIENSDVSRHIYFREEDLGVLKVEALKKRLLEIDSLMNVRTINMALKPDTDIRSLISEHDFIINTLDEPYIGYTSAKISRVCIENDKAHFIAGGFDAHLASTGELIIPGVTPCVECYATYFKERLKDWKPEKHPVFKREKLIGGLSSMSLFSASFASIEIIKYLIGITSSTGNYKIRGELLFDNLELTYLNVDRDNNCKVCGDYHEK